MIELTGTALGDEAARRLAERHRDIQPGMTTVELDRAEQRYGFEFAEDRRAFLGVGLPVGGSNWPDGRNGDSADLRARLSWPVEGVLFDVAHNVYWHREWGQRPTEPAAAVRLARDFLSTVPRLVPVHSHRYLPAGRGSFGHPVLSMYQTDIIYYGMNLLDYVYQEFIAGPGNDRSDLQWQPEATVPFWREFLE